MIPLRHITGIILLVALSYTSAKGQQNNLRVFFHPKEFYKKYFPNLKVKRPAFDSLYIKSYPNFLTAGSHVLLPAIDLDLHSKSTRPGSRDAGSTLRTNVGSVMAFTLGYRFISAGFAVVLSPQHNGKENHATSRYRTATIKYNGDAYSFQFKYMRTRGFTDINSFNSNVDGSVLQRPDLRTKEFQFESMYNLHWRRYAYYSPLEYTHRQLKTAVGILIKAGVYYNEIAADSNILATNQRTYYENFENITTIRTTSVKLAPGLGANVVFLKRFYVGAAVFAPYNLYVYNLFSEHDERKQRGTSLAFVIDGNLSAGYQSERFYAGVRYQADNRCIKLGSAELNMTLSYVGFDVGYRFNTPRSVREFYKKTMPPGM